MNDQVLVNDFGGAAVSLKTSVTECADPARNKAAGVNVNVVIAPDLEVFSGVAGMASSFNETVLVSTCVEPPSFNSTRREASGNTPTWPAPGESDLTVTGAVVGTESAQAIAASKRA